MKLKPWSSVSAASSREDARIIPDISSPWDGHFCFASLLLSAARSPPPPPPPQWTVDGRYADDLTFRARVHIAVSLSSFVRTLFLPTVSRRALFIRALLKRHLRLRHFARHTSRIDIIIDGAPVRPSVARLSRTNVAFALLQKLLRFYWSYSRIRDDCPPALRGVYLSRESRLRGAIRRTTGVESVLLSSTRSPRFVACASSPLDRAVA